MRNDASDNDPNVPRTVRRSRPAEVLHFERNADPSSKGYVPSANNPYDAYGAIDPDAPDDDYRYTRRTPMARRAPAAQRPSEPRRENNDAVLQGRGVAGGFSKKAVSDGYEPYDGYDYDRGGYSMGADTPVDGNWQRDAPAGYDQGGRPSAQGGMLHRRRARRSSQDGPLSSYDEAAYGAGYSAGYGSNGAAYGPSAAGYGSAGYGGANYGGGYPNGYGPQGIRPQGASGGPNKPRRFRHKGLVIFVAVIAALVGVYALVFSPIDQKLAFSDTESEGLSQQLSWNVPLTPYYVLALGSDAREGDTVSRTDTMMLVRVDPIESKLTLVSIPRDTMVQIEGYGTQKINAAYAFGGAAGAVKAVQELTGVPISHVAVVKFDGVSGIVDYLGGITVNVPVAVNDPNYTGLVLSAGEQTMDGNTAMLFSRVRHGFANGDFQRQEDQRLVLQAILSKCLSLNVTQLPGLADALGGLVSTDMRCYELMPLLARFMITSPTIYSCSLPGTTETVNGISYVVCDSSQVQAVMAKVDAGSDPNSDPTQEAAANAAA